MKYSPRSFLLPAICTALFLVAAGTSCAQFSPNPVTGTLTGGITLASGTGTIASTGKISRGNDTKESLTVSGNGTTVLNFGVVVQTGSDRAIKADGTNIGINNEAGGLITAPDGDAVRSSTAGTSITLINSGTISVTAGNVNGGQAVDFNSITTGSNSITNSGLITDTGNDAVRPGVSGSVGNSGTITGIGAGSAGIYAKTSNNVGNSGVVISNSGLINGGQHGITGGNTTNTLSGSYSMSITNQAGGVIQGGDGSGVHISGINGNELVTITNAAGGSIMGTGTGGDGDGVDVDGLINLTNNGVIKSLNSFNAASEGVSAGGGTIINTGTIEGDIISGSNGTGVGRGITMTGIDNGPGIPADPIYGAVNITNSGLVKGQSDSAILISGSGSGFAVTITNQAGGIIEGAGAVAAAIQTGSDNDTIINSGTIIADASGKAIDMGAGNNTLQLLGGSITGNISGGGSGTNSLVIDPGAGNSFSYAGGFSNFSSAAINSGTVTLSGSSTYSGTTSINGGKLLMNGSINNSKVVVKSGGTLGGSGSSGAVTVNGGGALSPGNSPGIYTTPSLTINSGSLANGGGQYQVQITASAGVPVAGTTYDQTILSGTGAILSLDKTASTGSILTLNVAGSLHTEGIASGGNPYLAMGGNSSLDNYFILNLQDNAATRDTTNNRFAIASDGLSFVTIDYDANEFSANNPNGIGTFTLNGQEWAISYTGDFDTNSTTGGNDVVITAIPEPGAYALVPGGFGMLALFRSRKRSPAVASSK